MIKVNRWLVWLEKMTQKQTFKKIHPVAMQIVSQCMSSFWSFIIHRCLLNPCYETLLHRWRHTVTLIINHINGVVSIDHGRHGKDWREAVSFGVEIDGVVINGKGDTVGWIVHHTIHALSALFDICGVRTPRIDRVSKRTSFITRIDTANAQVGMHSLACYI